MTSATITETFDHVLETDPKRVALVGPTRSLRYDELDAAADAAAAALCESGVRPGDRVAASLPNDVDIVVAFHGVMRLGAIWVGVNRALAPPEKGSLLAASAPTLLLADPETAAAHHATWRVLPVAPTGGDSGVDLLSGPQGAARRPPPDATHRRRSPSPAGPPAYPRGSSTRSGTYSSRRRRSSPAGATTKRFARATASRSPS